MFSCCATATDGGSEIRSTSDRTRADEEVEEVQKDVQVVVAAPVILQEDPSSKKGAPSEDAKPPVPEPAAELDPAGVVNVDLPVEFEVEVRSDSNNLQMTVGTTTGSHLVVVGVTAEGPCGDAWAVRFPEKAIRPNDRILEINGSTGTSAALMNKLKKAGEQMAAGEPCRMKLRRPKTLELRLVKENSSEKLGLELIEIGSMLVFVKGDCNTGVIGQWNDKNPTAQMHKGDLVVAVNGVTASSADMMTAIETSTKEISMTFQSHDFYDALSTPRQSMHLV